MSSSPQPITVAIVEDDSTIRDSLAALVGGTPAFQCIRACGNAETAMARLPADQPDVVLMDIQLPGASGIDCTRRIKELSPRTQVIMLTVFDDDDCVFESLAVGASGYLLKRTPPAQILEAIADVHRGGSPMNSHIARKVVESMRRTTRPSEATVLSPREEEILGLLAKGYRYKEIADQLAISIDTVRTHIRRIYEKLHVTSRIEAVMKHSGK